MTVIAAAKCIEKGRLLKHVIVYSHLPHSQDLVLCPSWFSPRIKMTILQMGRGSRDGEREGGGVARKGKKECGYYVYVLPPRNEYNHYVLQTY